MALTMLVKLPIKPELFDEACAAMASVGPTVRQENGCIAYDFYSAEGDRSAIHGIEIWADEAALDVHSKQPHMTPFREKLMPMMSGPIEFQKLTKVNG